MLRGYFDGRFDQMIYESERRILARFLAAWLSAWIGMRLLHIRPNIPKAQVIADRRATSYIQSAESSSLEAKEGDELRARTTPPLAGKTMDLTLYAVTRALDVVVGELWSTRKARRVATGRWTRLESFIGRTADAGVFAFSSGMVMWAWFYRPDRLPRAYNEWIQEVAQVDDRLVEALRKVRSGEFIYGKETGQAPLLQGMCKEHSWPLEWGDPAITTPIPCEMVHMGVGPSCELHAASRFARTFRFALATYLPLNVIMRIRTPSRGAFIQALKDATRSSAFLGAFVNERDRRTETIYPEVADEKYLLLMALKLLLLNEAP
ncbi:hypothetical protein FGG08_001090 [Glutinoglossum americanum]|uniref:Uncharacterized protein n=1 Tax=Glutinoglossum americanum TaxID=1670608 RepID=A0A9P8I2S2_9PEZI|nr:hypothetical protein FGG08_001090 [Glutinoglossum americanum]